MQSSKNDAIAKKKEVLERLRKKKRDKEKDRTKLAEEQRKQQAEGFTQDKFNKMLDESPHIKQMEEEKRAEIKAKAAQAHMFSPSPLKKEKQRFLSIACFVGEQNIAPRVGS